MLSDKDKYRLVEIARKYKVSRVYLFGSSLDRNKEASDIDLGVEGVPDSKYFEFYGELMMALSKPVDLVDLKKESLLSSMIRAEGILLYG